ncbi:hypothetical protein Tco_1491086 [Tanacetum coccineum]
MLGLPGLVVSESLREIASKADLCDYWTGISYVSDFLSTVPSYTLIREPLRSMDEVATVNVLYLLAYYLFRHASGRKHGARMLIRHPLRQHNIDELVRLRIYNWLRDVMTWLAMGPERQQDRAVARAAHIDPEVAQEGAPADPTPIQPQQMPQAADPAPRTMPQRMQRLKEEVHRLRESLREQQVLLKRVSGDQERVTTWVVDRITRLMQ